MSLEDQQFCEECGKPLAPGVKFCEECGSPVPELQTRVVADTTPTTPEGTVLQPLAVIPFSYQQHGVFSIDRCTLVIYPDRIVISYVPKNRVKEFDQAMVEVQAVLAEKQLEGKKFWEFAGSAGIALFKLAWSPVDFYTQDAVQERKSLQYITIPTRPWEQYLSMEPGAVLAEDERNRVILRDTISWIRGESDPSTDTDQILIGLSAGVTRLFFDFGTFFMARKVLFSFLLPSPGPSERIIGVVPSANEQEVGGFGFQYTWNMVVTEARVMFCMIEDDVADEMNTWIENQKKEAKKSGQKLRVGELAGRPDAPWQRFMTSPASSLLVNEVNFFIPLTAIQKVKIVLDGQKQTDKLRFFLPGEPYDIVFPNGSGGHIRQLLEKVLPGRIF